MVGCHANSSHTQNLETATVMSFNLNIAALLPEVGMLPITLYIQNLSHDLTALLDEKVC